MLKNNSQAFFHKYRWLSWLMLQSILFLLGYHLAIKPMGDKLQQQKVSFQQLVAETNKIKTQLNQPLPANQNCVKKTTANHFLLSNLARLSQQSGVNLKSLQQKNQRAQAILLGNYSNLNNFLQQLLQMSCLITLKKLRLHADNNQLIMNLNFNF